MLKYFLIKPSYVFIKLFLYSAPLRLSGVYATEAPVAAVQRIGLLASPAMSWDSCHHSATVIICAEEPEWGKKANEKAQCEKCEEESSEGDVTHHVLLAQNIFLL